LTAEGGGVLANVGIRCRFINSLLILEPSTSWQEVREAFMVLLTLIVRPLRNRLVRDSVLSAESASLISLAHGLQLLIDCENREDSFWSGWGHVDRARDNMRRLESSAVDFVFNPAEVLGSGRIQWSLQY